MRVLVACEYSGVVRDAFIAAGHEATSCDLLPTERPGPHFQCDVLSLSLSGFDIMIAHPPCTHLAVSGARWFKDKREEQEAAVRFFIALADAPVPRVCVENPVSIMSTRYRKPDQVIQPWMFGHGETKATCLWLRGLPLLKSTLLDARSLPLLESTETVLGREARVHMLPPSPDRWKLRSLTYKGIADAMASQWGTS